jgi:hypothetical protein
VRRHRLGARLDVDHVGVGDVEPAMQVEQAGVEADVIGFARLAEITDETNVRDGLVRLRNQLADDRVRRWLRPRSLMDSPR